MKSYVWKLGSATLLAALMLGPAMGQDNNALKREKSARKEKQDRELKELSEDQEKNEQVIVIRSRTGKDGKVTIEMKGGDVKVNGKPLKDFKDDNFIVSRDDEGLLEDKFHAEKDMNDAMVFTMPRSRFRVQGFPGGYSFSPGENIFKKGPLLGVSTEAVAEGAKITEVSGESAAEKAGLKKDDIITGVNDIKIRTPQDLVKAIGGFKPEDKINISILRDGKSQTLAAVLGERNADMMNLSPISRNFNFNFAPFNKMPGWNPGGGPRLGIKAQETEEGKGVKVLEVDEDSPAEKAGVKEGDIINEFNGQAVENIDVLGKLAHEAMAKPSFHLKVTRDGKTQDLEVKIPKNLKTRNL
jgi:serine protease Do